MDIDNSKVIKYLKLLKKHSSKLNIFGAEFHEFKLYSKLSEKEIKDFEYTYKIKLPEDYREFLLEIGNGGAGPYYGIFKLGEIDDGWSVSQWNEQDGMVGILSSSFPHTTRWNDLGGYPKEEECESEDEYELQLEAFESKYYHTEYINGAIPICHLGCAKRIWLVVTGMEKNNLWYDNRASLNGIYPIQNDKLTRLNFIQWYWDWLENSLTKLNNLETINELNRGLCCINKREGKEGSGKRKS